MKGSALWEERRADWRRETLPYWKYVAMSGFGLIAGAGVLAVIYWYALEQRALSAGRSYLPLREIGAVIITAALIWNPVRTYLREADLVFLLPSTSRIDAYLARARRTRLRGGRWPG